MPTPHAAPHSAVTLPPSLIIRPVNDVIGAEVVGLDLSVPLSRGTAELLNDALVRHQVLVFRDQDLTPESQIAFSRHFGELEPHVLDQFNLKAHPEILVITNLEEEGRPLGLRRAGWSWHSDISYKAEPSLGAALYARQVPPEGGDTLFASCAAAYEALDAGERAQLATLRGVHDYVWHVKTNLSHLPPMTAEQAAQVPPVIHPLIRTHPVSGRKGLYVSKGILKQIDGWEYAESRELIERLTDHLTQDRFVYRHRWRVGDLLLWDNRSTIHRATPFDEARFGRLMHRTTIRGDRPF